MKLPFVDHVGICIEEQRGGISRCTLSIEDLHFNSASIVHGGVLFTLADTAMGAALYPTLGPGEGCATIEIKINFFKPVVAGAVVCTAEIVSKGVVASLEACVCVDEVLVAKTATFAVFRRKHAAKPNPRRAAGTAPHGVRRR
jgi:acyl-CoA thioesterase